MTGFYYYLVTTQATPNRPSLWYGRLGVKLRGYGPEPHKNKRIKFIYYLLPKQLPYLFIKYLSTASAACLPSDIAHTIRDCPLLISPAAKTFSFEVL